MPSMLLRALSAVVVSSLLLISACGGEAIIDTDPGDEWSPLRLGEEADVGDGADGEGEAAGEAGANESRTFEVEDPGESL